MHKSYIRNYMSIDCTRNKILRGLVGAPCWWGPGARAIWAPLKSGPALEIDKGLLAHTRRGTGVPPPPKKKENRTIVILA